MQLRRVRRDIVVLQCVGRSQDIVVTYVVRLLIAEVARRLIRQVHERFIIAIRQAVDCRLVVFVHDAVRRVLVFRIDRQLCFVDLNRACASEVVVDAGVFTLFIQDVAESNRILIRTEICCRATFLILGVGTAFFNGNRANLVVIFKVRSSRCPRNIRVTIGLGSRAADIGIALEDFKRTICCCNGIAFFANQILPLCFDNKVWTRIIVARFINITIHTGLFCRNALARRIDFARITILQVSFLESRLESLIRNAVRTITAREGSCCRRRVRGYISFITIRLRLIIRFDRNCRLYLEDVLVRIFRSIRVETVVASRAGVPAGRRLAVEVRTERVAVWRCGVDLPVAACASRDGIRCLRCICCIMEGTICAACINDDSIVCRRLSNQCTIIMGVIQYDCAALTRRRQVDLFMSRDAIDIDVARGLNTNAIIDGGNAIAYRDICATNRYTFICTDLASVRSASSRCSATNGHVASRIDCEVLQTHRQSSIALQINLTTASLYFKTRMSQIFLLDKALGRTGRSSNIVPVRSDTIAYCYIRATVIRLCRRGMRSLRISLMPFRIIVLQWRTAVIRKLRSFAARYLTFRSGNPIITFAMFGICWIDRTPAAFTADEERNFTSRCCKRILKRGSNRCQIRIVYSRTAASTILSQPFRRFPRIRNTIGHIRFVRCR